MTVVIMAIELRILSFLLLGEVAGSKPGSSGSEPSLGQPLHSPGARTRPIPMTSMLTMSSVTVVVRVRVIRVVLSTSPRAASVTAMAAREVLGGVVPIARVGIGAIGIDGLVAVFDQVGVVGSGAIAAARTRRIKAGFIIMGSRG